MSTNSDPMVKCPICGFLYYHYTNIVCPRCNFDNKNISQNESLDALTATIAQKDAEIVRLRYALMDIDSYVDDESKIGRIIRKALEEVNDDNI